MTNADLYQRIVALPDSGSKSLAIAALLERRKMKEAASPLAFRSFVDKATRGRFQWYRHCEVLADRLEDVAAGRIKRLMVFLPPRHSKSEMVSRLFSAYYLSRNPDQYVGLASYGVELARTLARAARSNYREAGGSISSESAAVTHWETTQGGGMWAAGVGGAITGKGMGLGLLDDPTKDAADARSEVIRNGQREWWSSTFRTRLEPNGAIVVIQTRWALDDLSGWLLERESGEEPEGWHIVSLPALAEAKVRAFPSSCTVEADWREPGEALCTERYPVRELEKLRGQTSSHVWNALYQQHPVPREGNRFKWDWFRIVDAAPAKVLVRVRAWDLAGTDSDSADFTSGTLLSIDDRGATVIEDVVHGQWSPAQRDERIRATADADKARHGNVHIAIERESGIDGGPRMQALVRKLAGHQVAVEPARGSKEERAEPLASQAEAGNVSLVKGDWNPSFLMQITDFPYGKNDDDVDSASRAYNKAAALIEELRKRRGFAMPGLMMTGV